MLFDRLVLTIVLDDKPRISNLASTKKLWGVAGLTGSVAPEKVVPLPTYLVGSKR